MLQSITSPPAVAVAAAAAAAAEAEDELVVLVSVQNALDSLCARANERVELLFDMNSRRPGQLYPSKASARSDRDTQQQQRLDVLLENLSVSPDRVRVCMRVKPVKGGASTFGLAPAPRPNSKLSVAGGGGGGAPTFKSKTPTPMRFEEIVQNAAAHRLITRQSYSTTFNQERAPVDFSRVLSADICPLSNPVAACMRPLFAAAATPPSPLYTLPSLRNTVASSASKRSSLTSSSSSSATTMRTRPPSVPVSAEIDRHSSGSCALLADSQRSLVYSPLQAAAGLHVVVESDTHSVWPQALPAAFTYATLPRPTRHAKSCSPPPVSGSALTPTPILAAANSTTAMLFDLEVSSCSAPASAPPPLPSSVLCSRAALPALAHTESSQRADRCLICPNSIAHIVQYTQL